MDLRRNRESVARKPRCSSCDICKASNLASICAPCVNFRLNEYRTSLTSLKNVRDPLYSRLDRLLMKKRLFDDQVKWRAIQNDKLKKLKDHLTCLKMRLVEEKAKVAEASKTLRLKYDSVDLAFARIKERKALLVKLNNDLIYTQRLAIMAITSECQRRQSVIVKQICKLFPMCQVTPDGAKDESNGLYTEICNARLPRGLDLDSLPPDELAASLGYMVQFLNLIVPNLAAFVLHSSGFMGSSCSRIWQRDSYWDARASSPSEEHRLFLPRQNFCSFGGESSWSDKSSINLDVAPVELERKPYLVNSSSTSSNYSLASQHSLETQKDLQKGISLLKKSVACITANCYNYLDLDVPSEAFTFEAFSQLLAILSSSKEAQSTRNSSQIACWSQENQDQQLKGSVRNVNSGGSSSSLPESMEETLRRNTFHNNPEASFVYCPEMIDNGRSEILEEEWDLVEHPTISQTSCQGKKIGRWIRAMFVGAPKK